MCYEKTEHGDRIWGAVAGKVDMSNISGIRLTEYLRKKGRNGQTCWNSCASR